LLEFPHGVIRCLFAAQRIEEDSPKYKEADLGDFLLRLQNSGDGVSGKLREFKRS
jgi:hypothetical protein